MKIRKMLAVILAASLIATSIRFPAFADVLKNEENTENVTESGTKADELPDTIVLTAETSDGIIVTMKAEISAFVPVRTASPSDAGEQSEAEEDAASPSEAIRADEFNPALLSLTAELMEEEKDEEAVDEALEKETKDDNIASRKTYDICVLYNGEKTEPLPGKKVEVSFRLPDVPSGADGVNVYHHTESGIETVVDNVKLDEAGDSQSAEETEKTAIETAEAKTVEEAENTDEKADTDTNSAVITVTGETTGFSYYTIDFTYNEKTVSIPGGSAGTPLADILKEVGIEKKIMAVEAYRDAECTEPAEEGTVKNENGDALFKVYEANGVWYIDAINAFDTEHGLYVKTENAEYKIKVTDDQNGNVCKIGDTEYATVQAAVTASTGTSETPVEIDMIADSTENVSVASGKYIILDLNGHVLKGSGSGSVITNDGTLTITDSDASGQTHEAHYFRVVQVTGDTSMWELLSSTPETYDYEYSEGKLKEKGETEETTVIPAINTVIKVDGGCITGGGTGQGSGININNNGTLTLNSGTICGNNAGYGDNCDGGGVYVNSGATFTMTGGTICGNHAHNGSGVDVAGTFDMKEGTICYNKTYHMGAVIVEKGKIFRMSGGTISHNFAKTCGAGIRTQEGTAYISGNASIIYNCTEGGNGSAIQVGLGTVIMSGGTVAHNYNTGTSEEYSAAVLAWDNGGVFNMSGGIITDNACGGATCNNSTVTIGGTAEISGNTSKDGTVRNLYLYSGKKIALGTGTGAGKNGVPVPASGMSVGVTTQTAPLAGSPVSITDSNNADCSSCFFSDNTPYYIYNDSSDSNKIKLGLPGDKKALIVETGILYDNVQTAVSIAQDHGQTVKMIADSQENVSVSTGKTVTFDLNGYVLKGTGDGSVISNSGTMMINDSNKTRTHYFTYSSSGAWSLLSEPTKEQKDAAVTIDQITDKTEVVKVSGGCITGGNSESANGGGILVYEDRAFTMTGGNICGNKAKQGGGLYTGSNTKVSLSNVTIAGNYAKEYCGGMMFNGDAGSGRTPSLTIGGEVRIVKNISPNDKNLTLWTDNTPLKIESSIAGSRIGLTIRKSGDATSAGAFTSSGTADDAAYFFSDAAAYGVAFVTDHLELKNQYTVSLDANEGTAGTVTSVSALDGIEMPAIKGNGALPARTGYAFAGYYDARTDGTKYYNSDGTGAKAWDKQAGATLYAGWTAKTAPQASNLTFTPPASPVYDKTEKVASFTGQSGMGTITAKYRAAGTKEWSADAPVDAGDYEVQAVVGEGTTYAAAELTDEDWKFTISPAKLTIDGATADEKKYDGTTGAVVHKDGAYIKEGLFSGDIVSIASATGTFETKDAGQGLDVTIVYTLGGEDADNYTAGNSTTSADIARRKLTLTSATASKVYDGTPLADNTVTVTGDGFAGEENATYSVTGSRTLAGTSKNTFTYTLTGGAKAGNYDITTAEGTLEVKKRKLAKPSADRTDFTYTGSEQGPVITGFDENMMTVTGKGKATAAGNYTLTYALKDKTNYCWTDDSTENKTIEWAIARAAETVPSEEIGLVYDGKVKTGVKAGAGYTLSGNTATDAGIYTATATPDSNHKWNDGTTESKSISWSIARATYDMSGVSFDNKEVQYDGKPKSLAITGALPNGVAVSYEGNGKTEAGVYTVTAKFAGDYVNYETIPAKTAKLTINALTKYKITYDLSGGKWTAGGGNPTEYTVKSDFTLKAPERDGYVFTGWEGTDLKKPETIVIVERGSTGDRSYKANWNQAEGKKIAGRTVEVTGEIVIPDTKLTDEKALVVSGSAANVTSFSSDHVEEAVLEQLAESFPKAKTFTFGITVELKALEENKKSTSAGTKVTYDATPYIQAIDTDGTVNEKIAVSNDDLNGKAVNLHLAVPKDTEAASAEIRHVSTGRASETYASRVYTDESGEKYVEVSITHFSTFEITLQESGSDPEPSEDDSDSSASTGAAWIRDAKGWRYLLANGSYAANDWYELDNPYASGAQEKKSWFHFGSDGYMQTGWFTDKDDKKYYLHPVSDGTQGRMYHGKQKIDGKEYEFSEVHDGYFGHLIETGTRKAAK